MPIFQFVIWTFLNLHVKWFRWSRRNFPIGCKTCFAVFPAEGFLKRFQIDSECSINEQHAFTGSFDLQPLLNHWHPSGDYFSVNTRNVFHIFIKNSRFSVCTQTMLLHPASITSFKSAFFIPLAPFSIFSIISLKYIKRWFLFFFQFKKNIINLKPIAKHIFIKESESCQFILQTDTCLYAKRLRIFH